MFSPVYTKQFKRNLKKVKKDPNKNIELLKGIMLKILNREPLKVKHKDHPLQGHYKNCRECHILPDWLLIYKVDKKSNEVYFVQTGSHSELFE